MFPSSTEDGSIEAASQPSGCLNLSSFRPQLRTAPLKQGLLPHCRICDRLFPSSTEDGSIEAMTQQHSPAASAAVSVLN